MFGERRVRVVSLPVHEVVDWLARGTTGRIPEYLVEPLAANLPGNTTVISAQTDFWRRTVDFLVSHPSFDPVPDGAPAPQSPDGLVVERRVLRVVPPELEAEWQEFLDLRRAAGRAS